jgi:hypothetical protein
VAPWASEVLQACCVASLGSAIDLTGTVNLTLHAPQTHTSSSLAMNQGPPLQSLPFPFLACLHGWHTLFLVLTECWDCSPRPHLARARLVYPQLTGSDRQSQRRPSCPQPGTCKSALPPPCSRGLPGAPDHSFLLYHIGRCHFH